MRYCATRTFIALSSSPRVMVVEPTFAAGSPGELFAFSAGESFFEGSAFEGSAFEGSAFEGSACFESGSLVVVVSLPVAGAVSVFIDAFSPAQPLASKNAKPIIHRQLVTLLFIKLLLSKADSLILIYCIIHKCNRFSIIPNGHYFLLTIFAQSGFMRGIVSRNYLK